MKRVSKKTFLQQYKSIFDENLIEKEIHLKNGSKTVYTATKMVHVESIRKLLKEFSYARESPVSLTTFFTYKPFYCVLPSEKEKQSCVCINYQNPHLLLKANNYYRSSKKLQPHESLTVFIQELKSGKKFQECEDDKASTFHKYESVLES